jgi:hypothetical protein
MWDRKERERVEKRLLAGIDFGVSPADCWLWTGAIHRDGYAAIRAGGKHRKVHRIAYELLVGPIPEGLQLDHLCRERHCLNPLHLEPTTPSENKRRGTNQNSVKTRCDNGHPFDDKNTYIDSRGWRGCRTCRDEAKRRYLARRAA